MRLTLRTLLAYMDDTLDPVHAREIGQKIKDSPTATKLMGRVRDVMRRRRLTAPKLTGPGAGLDVNTVAEYLDNTAAPERVPDIEKVCLESDMHLAEVGACHQILTLVLGEPADIEPETRRRMYGLVPSEEAQTASSEPAPSRTVGTPRRVGTLADTMPDYLRQPPLWKTAVPVGATVLILLLLGYVVYRSLGNPPVEKTAVAQKKSSTAVSSPEVPETAPAAPTGAPSVDKQPASTEAAKEESDSDTKKAEESSPTEAELPPTESAPSDQEPVPAVPAVPDAGTTQPEPPVPSDREAPEKGAPVAPAAPRQVAQYTSASGLLLNYDAEADTWTRLPSRALIYAGDSVLAPPLYRARFDLEVGGELEAVGPTRLEMLPAQGDGAVAFRLEFGQVTLRDLPVGTNVSVELDGKSWQFGVQSGGSVLAFEAATRLPSGFESTLQGPARDFQLFISQGQVTWTSGPGNGRAEGSSVLTLLSSQEGAGPMPVVSPLADAPKWVEGAEQGILDQQAAHRLQDELVVPFDKPVTLPLIEATQDRRREVRTLAVDCLGAMGRLAALCEALTDDAPGVRREAIVWLRRALAEGGERATAVRDALKSFRPSESGDHLYRLLWGYTDRDLRDGGAEQLVEFLDHDDLSVREAALYNLEEITGRTFNYQADAPPAQRDRSVRQWRKLLADGKLVVRQRGRI